MAFRFDKVRHFDESLGDMEDIDGGGRYSIFAPNIIGSASFSPGGWGAAEGGKNGSLLELENTSLLLSARQFDFSNLLEAIDENDVGTPRLSDFIVKSVTDLNADHRLEMLAIHVNVYGRENGDAYEWDERRGVNIIEGLDEPLPTIGNQVRILLDARRMSRSLRLPIEIAHHRR